MTGLSMHILVSNDDGYDSPWLQYLVDALVPFGKVSVVAPRYDQSGVSSALTLGRPLRAFTMPNGFIQVDGTPADCAHLGITGLLDDMPDIVVSGINKGANLGDDVLYSGTVGAAMEGRFLDLPGLAFSMLNYNSTHVETAQAVVTTVMRGLLETRLPKHAMLNINIPDISLAECKGLAATRLGHRHIAADVNKTSDPYGKPIYWIGPAGEPKDAGVGTDFHAVKNNWVSVTPLQADLSDHKNLDDLAAWLKTTIPLEQL